MTSKILTCQTGNQKWKLLVSLLHLVPYHSQSWVPWVFPDILTSAPFASASPGCLLVLTSSFWTYISSPCEASPWLPCHMCSPIPFFFSCSCWSLWLLWEVVTPHSGITWSHLSILLTGLRVFSFIFQQPSRIGYLFFSSFLWGKGIFLSPLSSHSVLFVPFLSSLQVTMTCRVLWWFVFFFYHIVNREHQRAYSLLSPQNTSTVGGQ